MKRVKPRFPVRSSRVQALSITRCNRDAIPVLNWLQASIGRSCRRREGSRAQGQRERGWLYGSCDEALPEFWVSKLQSLESVCSHWSITCSMIVKMVRSVMDAQILKWKWGFGKSRRRETAYKLTTAWSLWGKMHQYLGKERCCSDESI